MDLKTLVKSPFTGISGWRLWCDVRYHAGWRIQRHEAKPLWRVIGPAGGKRIVANEDEALSYVRGQSLEAPRIDHLVLIIPGLNNLALNYRLLEKALKKDGYCVEIWDYPSNHTDVRGHAQRLSQLVGALEGVKKVSFVTHSLGGLIVRAMLAEDPEWLKRIKPGGIIMVAPPHCGSFLADIVHDKLKLTGIYEWVCGGVGYELTTKGASELPELKVDVGIITGGSGRKWGFSPLAGEDNDGWVTLASSQGGGNHPHIQICGWPHTLIMWNPALSKNVLEYLKNGEFAH